MAIPAEAKVFAEALDPTDILDYQVDLSALLEDGEGVSAHTLTLPTESVLLGLEVKTTGGYSTSLTANKLRFWLGIIPEEQANTAFISGTTLPLVVTITTNSAPPRTKQRTIAVKVIQR